MSKKSYIVAFSKIASAILALALICGLTPIANAAGDNTADQSSIVTLDTPVQSEEDPPATQEESSTPAASGSSSATQEESSSSSSSSSSSGIQEESSTPTASDSDDVEIALQSEAAYTVSSFVGYKDMFTALAKTKIDGDKKTNQAALKLPTKLWVKLDAASLTAYKTDHAADFAASETARTAHNDALAGGTPAEPTAADPYSNVTIPEDAVQVSVTTWTCRDDYEATDYDLYTFDPTLDADFTPAEGVDLPFLEVEVGEVKAGARATFSEFDWIALVNTYTAGKGNTAYSDHFYAAVPFTSGGGGNLAWTDSGVAAADRWDGTADATCPVAGTTYSPTTPEQLLYALQQAAADTSATPFTIELPANGAMDLGGREHNLWPYIKVTSPLTLNGNGCTLYNLYMCNDATAWSDGSEGNHGTGLISDAYSLQVSNLDFDGTNLLGYYMAAASNNNGVGALVGKIYADSALATTDAITNVQVRNALTIARGNGAGALLGRFADDKTNTPASSVRILDDCSAINVVSMGGDHIGGLTGATAFFGGSSRTSYINRCFAVEAIIVAYGTDASAPGHSGGLFSCLDGQDYAITNSFVDAQVYGQSECGVFTGACGGTTRVAIINCFSSGFVDGVSMLGGFVGSSKSGQTYFFDCYSTALVGVSSAGNNVGGFLGYSGTGTDGAITGMSNCYAAGEVGNAATQSEGATKGVAQATNAGGFIGSSRRPNSNASLAVIVNCFYDKQTTAMREYDMGNDACLSLNKVVTSTDDKRYLTGVLKTKIGDPGLQGCLTTSTKDKEGSGLAEVPGPAVSINTGGTDVYVGFYGMRDDTACMGAYYDAAFKGWADSTTVAQAAFGWDTSTDGHYPELIAFSDNKAGFSDEDAAIAAAYSKSSTSTVKLETWEKGLKASNGQIDGSTLPATTYDTVRDITTRFDLTSSGGEKWFTTATQDGADDDRATTTIQGQTRNVMDLLNDGTWYGDSFSPGMEWLRVGTTVDGVAASRRLRVTPTAGLEAGASQNRYQTSTGADEFYDHADDVLFFYTTSARWAKNKADVTTGVYPDTSPTGSAVPPTGVGGITRKPNDITSDQTLYANGAADGVFDTFFGTDGDNGQNDLYGTDGTDAATGLDMSYMSRGYQAAIDGALGDNSANGSHVYTYIRPISNFDPVTGKVSAGDLLETWDDEVYADRFNGYQKFDSENSQYLIEYVWELEDGRLIRDAKIFTVKAVPFDATITAYESGGINASAAGDESLADTDDVFVGIDCDVTDVDNYDFATQTSEHKTDTTHPDFGSHVVASWKNTNGLKSQTRLKVEFVFDPSGAGADKQYFSAILENPKAGDTIDIPYTFWRIITLENGEYYSIPQTLNRVYTVKQDAATGCMYLYFDKQDEKDPNGAHPELTMTDMEDTLNVSVELSSGLVLHKDTNADTTSGSGDYSDLTKQFTYNLYFNDGLVDAEDNPTPGTYSYNIYNDNGTPDDYSDDTLAPATTARPNSGIFVSGTNLSTPVATTSADGGTAQTVALSDNEYVSILGAKAGYSYRFEELDYKDANGTDAQVAKYTPAYAIDTGDTTSATGLDAVNSTWNEYESVVTKTSGRDTGAQTLPAYAEKTVEGAVVDNTISRTNVINTFKEVIPSGVSSEAQWPWLLILVAVVLMTLGGGYALYRKHNRGIKPQKMVASHSRGAALLR